MIIVMIFAVILLYAGLDRYMSKSNSIRGSDNRDTQQPIRAESTTHFPGEAASPDAGTTGLAWTALDDLQLNRLLKDSSDRAETFRRNSR